MVVVASHEFSVLYLIAFPEEVSKAEAKHYTPMIINHRSASGGARVDHNIESESCFGNWMPLEWCKAR